MTSTLLRFFRSGNPRVLILGLVLFCGGLAGAMGCAKGLPDPESEGAQLYVRYCSAEGCHGPIPPRGDGPGYWRNQYDRMITLMEEKGAPLPSPQEDRIIREYLDKHAR